MKDAKNKTNLDDIEIVNEQGKIVGNLGRDTIIVDGKEVPYEEAYKDKHEQIEDKD